MKLNRVLIRQWPGSVWPCMDSIVDKSQPFAYTFTLRRC
jgi:hypothetical protein